MVDVDLLVLVINELVFCIAIVRTLHIPAFTKLLLAHVVSVDKVGVGVILFIILVRSRFADWDYSRAVCGCRGDSQTFILLVPLVMLQTMGLALRLLPTVVLVIVSTVFILILVPNRGIVDSRISVEQALSLRRCGLLLSIRLVSYLPPLASASLTVDASCRWS